MEVLLPSDVCPRCGYSVTMRNVTEDEKIQWGDKEYTVRKVKSLKCPVCKGKVMLLKEANRVADLARKQHEDEQPKTKKGGSKKRATKG